MAVLKNEWIGVETNIGSLQVSQEKDGWTVLQLPGHEAYLSLRFVFHFFSDLHRSSSSFLQR